MSQKQNNTSIFELLEKYGFTIETFYVRKSYCDLNLLFKFPDIKETLKQQLPSITINYSIQEIFYIVKEVFSNFGMKVINDKFSNRFEIGSTTYSAYLMIDLQDQTLAFPRNCCLGYKDTMVDELKEMMKDKYSSTEKIEQIIYEKQDRFELLDLK